jgi:uncharacterized protein (TIGR03437 family)
LGFTGNNGPATSAQIAVPTGVTVDAGGNLYVTGSTNRVWKVSNGVLTTIAGNGTTGGSGDNGPAILAQLQYPNGSAIDLAGNVYVADALNNSIRKISNGTITTIAGNRTAGFSGDNGPATGAQLWNPTGVAVGTAGDLYIADAANGRIRKVSNGVISTVAGNGGRGFSGDNGPATRAELLNPQGIALDTAGNLYIVDMQEHRIRKVSNGVITTIAGNGTAGSSGDNGPAILAQLHYPYGIAVDLAGNVYIADTENYSIRKISNGTITTIAGNGTAGFSGDNGPAIRAQLNLPFGVAVDAGGNVYVADGVNNRIRVLRPTEVSCTYSVFPASLNASAPGGSFTVSIQATAGCPWTVSGLPDWITASAASSSAGASFVTLAIAPNAGATRTAAVSIGGTLVQITESSPFSINPGGILNTASSAVGAPLSPGSIASAYGTFLVNGLTTAANAPLPDSLAGLSMRFGSVLKAPLFAVSGGQVNFQVPWELAGQSQASISATANGQTTTTQTMNLAPFAPGIFSMNARGTGQGAILDTSYRLVDPSNPATAGSTVVQIYCTGLGAVTNQPPSGSQPSSDLLSATIATPGVAIGGAEAVVLFSGLAPGSVGEYQVNALVPAQSSKGEAVPVVIAIGGVSSNVVTMAVQ